MEKVLPSWDICSCNKALNPLADVQWMGHLLDVFTTAIKVDVTITIKWPRRALGHFVTEQK